MKRIFAAIGVVFLAIAMLTGCKTPPNCILMTSGTTIGFDVSESLATASPQATLAYKRVELALVPVGTNNYTPDALMEFRFESSMFAKNYIYSRVATGPNATVQTPAALMMAKSPDGKMPDFTNLFFSLPSPSIPPTKPNQ